MSAPLKPDFEAPTAASSGGSDGPLETSGRNFFALGTGEVLARVIAFGGMLILARRLGVEGLGVVSFAAAVLLYLSRVVDAGIDLGIGIREVSVRREALGEFIAPLLAFRLVVAVVVILIGGMAAYFFLPPREGMVTALYCLTLIPVALSARWVLTGLDRAFAAGLSRAVGELAVLIVVVLTVQGVTDIWRVPLAQFVGDLVATLVVISGLRRLRVPFAVKWNGAVIRPLVIRHIVPYVGSTLLGIVLFNADILFLRMFRDASAVGLYAAAYALLSFPINIGGTYALTLIPSLTRLDPTTRQVVFQQAAARVFLVILPITIGGGMISAELLTRIYSAEFAPAAPVLTLLLLSAPLSLLRSVATTAIMAERREDLLFRVVGVSALTNIVLNLIAVPLWGLTGAAAVTVATELLRLVLSQRFATHLGFPVPHIARAWKPAVAGALMAGLLVTPVGNNPWLAIPAAAAVYGAVLMMLGALRFRPGALPQLNV